MTDTPKISRPPQFMVGRQFPTMAEFLAFYLHESRRIIIQQAFKDHTKESQVRRASKVKYEDLPVEIVTMYMDEVAHIITGLTPFMSEMGTGVQMDLITTITALEKVKKETSNSTVDKIVNECFEAIGWSEAPQDSVEGDEPTAE